MVSQLVSLDAAVAAAPDAQRGVVWIVEDGPPVLSSCELSTGDVTRHATLPGAPAGIALSGDGQALVITLAGGSLVRVPADEPGEPAAAVAQTADVLGQVATTAPRTGPGYALAVSSSQQRLVSIRLSDGRVRPVVTATGISGVATDSRDTWIASTTGGEGLMQRVSGGAAVGMVSNLLPTGHITRSADGELLLVAHPGADRVSAFRFGDGSTTTCATNVSEVEGAVVEMHGLEDGSFLVVSRKGLALVDALADLESRPRLVPPAEPLFVRSWIPLQYDLSGSGLTDAEVSFLVHGDPDAALISSTSFSTAPGGKLVPMLIAGGVLGTFELSMVETAGGNELDRVSFEVTDHWFDPDRGPAQMYMGDNAPASAGEWGGGPNAPQNLGTLTHNGHWRVAALLVNTTDGAYPTAQADLDAARAAVLDELQDGVSVDGQTRSARHYYEELSNWDGTRGLTIQAYSNRVFGPVDLPQGWTTYFTQKRDASGALIDPADERWSSMGATVQTVVTRALSQGVLTTADFGNFDVLMILPFSPDAPLMGSKRFVWPHANARVTVLAGKNAKTDQRTFGFVFVPPDFATQDGRRLHATMSHELGHTLGLPDLYNMPDYAPDVTSRLTNGWDLMAGSSNDLPHYSLSNRMRQGWVRSGDLKLYNFQGQGSIDESVTLHAAELGTPPPGSGRVRGIELRMADGWNTYVEYRAKQGGQIGDTLPAGQDQRVVVTDVTSDRFATPTSRPPIVFVHNDEDGDGPILDTGADYEEIDPATQKSVILSVTAKAADSATVQIKYGSNGRPDPGLRPWLGPPDWKSPDIEVRNAKAQADPANWANCPWIGHPNTVVAKVRNDGDLLAKGVVVNFYAIKFTTGDGPMVPIGSDKRDVQPGATQEFTTTWSPVDDGHHCIVVRIKLYQDPTLAGVIETNIYNNEARSNYTRFVSKSASPSNRVGAELLLANPFDEPTHVHAVVTQTHRFHRVYVDHQWLRVDGHGQAPIQVFDEALAGFPEEDELGSDLVNKELWSRDNKVSVEGWVQRPFPSDCGAPTLTGGAAVRVGSGRATIVRIDEARLGNASGTVELDGGGPVGSGKVVLALYEVDASGAIDPLGDRLTAEARVQNGRFEAEFRELAAAKGRAVAHFLGTFGAAPADSEPVEVRR